MSIHVLDASAMVDYANAEPGGTVVRALLADPNATCYAHAMNMCEAYYHLFEKWMFAEHGSAFALCIRMA